MIDENIINHHLTNLEIQQCKEVIMNIREIIPNFNIIIGKDDSSASTSFFCIQDKEYSNSFHYYFVNNSDRDSYNITSFDDIYEEYYKNITDIKYEALLHYIISNKITSKENFEIVFNQGYCLKATKEDNGYYSFTPIHGYSSGMAMDEIMQYGYSFMKPVFAKEECPSCNNKWWFNTKNIPSGERYECICPKCGMLLKRKK